jgi:hypothetical protein
MQPTTPRRANHCPTTEADESSNSGARSHVKPSRCQQESDSCKRQSLPFEQTRLTPVVTVACNCQSGAKTPHPRRGSRWRIFLLRRIYPPWRLSSATCFFCTSNHIYNMPTLALLPISPHRLVDRFGAATSTARAHPVRLSISTQLFAYKCPVCGVDWEKFQ